MLKRFYMTEEELREMEIRLANDYTGTIKRAEWVSWLGCYRVAIEFYSEEEFKLFCDIHGYKPNKVNNLLMKEEG